MLLRFEICERVSQFREMDCRNVKGNMRVHCPTAIFCFSKVREEYRKKNIKEAMLICARGYTGVCIAQACKRCCTGQNEITDFFGVSFSVASISSKESESCLYCPFFSFSQSTFTRELTHTSKTRREAVSWREGGRDWDLPQNEYSKPF